MIGAIYAAKVELLVAIFLYPIAFTLVCEKLAQSKIVSATELMLLAYIVG
ncbi:hypothetical protein KJY73_02000 [Bowmanella sp. Y26]|nr:hypothetical protein [Bowmanella yangjiangensis]MBT1062322.1 hypothetical protein [Bowmanella yangjiangensis]